MYDQATLGLQLEKWATEPRNWQIQVVDDLDEAILSKTVAFLERWRPAGVDPMWSVDYFRWKLSDRNPAGPGFLSCAVAEGNVVGTVSITRTRFWYLGQIIQAAEIGDVYTHPDWLPRRTSHRPAGPRSNGLTRRVHGTSDYLTQSIFGRLVAETRERAFQDGIQLLYGTPNARSRAGFEKRLGFQLLASHDNRAFIRPTVRGMLHRDPRLRLVSPFLFLGGQVISSAMVSLWEMVRRTHGYSVDLMGQATAELDVLWDRVKTQYGCAVVRDRSYVQHRFIDHPLARYTIYRIARNNQLHGVMVTRLLTMPWGERYCAIADWWGDNSQPHLFPILLAHVIHAQDCKATNTDGVYLWCGPCRHQRRLLRFLGFLRGQTVPIIVFHHPASQVFMPHGRPLHFSLASSDNV